MNNRLIIYLTVFFLSTLLLQFAFNGSKSNYLYTELQQSHTENGKYQRDGIMWFDRETEVPLNGLVYDYSENGKRIEFGFLKNGYQDGVWYFFHENGQPSMENIYVDGDFINTTKKWDMDGTLIDNNY